MFHICKHLGGIRILFCFSLLISSQGCSSVNEPGQNLIPVTGVVTMDGSPLSGVTIMFNPTPGTDGNGGYAVTDSAGKFVLTDYGGKPGCPEGRYGVTFSKYTKPDGSPIPAGATRADVDFVEQMPMAYTIFKPTYLINEANVAVPSSLFEFHLNSKQKPPRLLLE